MLLSIKSKEVFHFKSDGSKLTLTARVLQKKIILKPPYISKTFQKLNSKPKSETLM